MTLSGEPYGCVTFVSCVEWGGAVLTQLAQRRTTSSASQDDSQPRSHVSVTAGQSSSQTAPTRLLALTASVCLKMAIEAHAVFHCGKSPRLFARTQLTIASPTSPYRIRPLLPPTLSAPVPPHRQHRSRHSGQSRIMRYRHHCGFLRARRGRPNGRSMPLSTSLQVESSQAQSALESREEKS
jgi:hypothetical protein